MKRLLSTLACFTVALALTGGYALGTTRVNEPEVVTRTVVQERYVDAGALIPVPGLPLDLVEARDWYTVEEYRDRVRGQILDRGYVDVCLHHLSVIDWSVRERDPLRDLQLGLIVETCNEVSRNGGEIPEDWPR